MTSICCIYLAFTIGGLGILKRQNDNNFASYSLRIINLENILSKNTLSKKRLLLGLVKFGSIMA